MRRTLLSFLAVVAIITGLSACGEDQLASPLDSVKVTQIGDEQPKLEFDEPFSVEETEVRVIEEGDGKAVTPEDVITFNFIVVNGVDGKVLGSSYESAPAAIKLSEDIMPGIAKGLEGQKVGSQVLVAIAPGDSFGAEGFESGVTDDDTLLFLAEILSASRPLARAEGAAVAPVPGLPTVTLSETGVPTIALGDGAAVTTLVVQPLIKGTGAEVEEGQSVTVHYTGALYSDGKVFDSSWDRDEPLPFTVGTGKVISGWDKALVGQTVGSQLLLVIPAADAYGDAGQGKIPAGATLIFVVDILAAT